MKLKITLLLILFSSLLINAIPAEAQYFRFDNLSQAEISQGVPQQEVEGILKFFGSMVGSGLYHTAGLHSTAGFDAGFHGIVTNVPDEFESLPTFIDENRVGLGFFYGNLGLPGNFEVMGRFFVLPLGAAQDLSLSAPRPVSSRGDITLIGGGLKYGLLQMPGLPKVMVMGAYHAVIVPDEFDFGTVNTFSFNLVASQSLLFLNVYAGAGVDITRLKVNDDVPIPELAGESFNETYPHLTIGSLFRPLPLVHVNAALNLGEFDTFDLGVGVSFR